MLKDNHNEPGSHPLSLPKQERFCQEYLLTANGTQAAIRAGYSKKTAAQTASRMLRYVNVAERINFLRNQAAARLNIRKERVLRELADIGLVNIGRILEIVSNTIKKVDPVTDEITEKSVQDIRLKDIPDDVWPAIKSINQTASGLSVVLHDKLRALELIAKIMGWLGSGRVSADETDDDGLNTADEIREFLETLPGPVEVKPISEYHSDN